jgi:3',5'-cyclic AMP phosphodiesterase CpdA
LHRHPEDLGYVSGCRNSIETEVRLSDIHYLFRFRDLVAATIQEHRRIIAEQGWCWWGWWKRPSEDSRNDIWDLLAKETGGQQSVAIGLFDSGNDKVYRAKVTGVIKPSGSESQLAVPEGQADHVPSYYRGSPFSRAWIKLTDIEEQPIQFFGKYSFVEVPKLPNYSPSTLARFANKKIVGPEELRGMDSTIWRIRPSLPTDSGEQILLTVQALSESVSAEIVRCKSDGILHLTDVHFAGGGHRNQHVWRYESETDGARQTMIEAVAAALGERPRIGLVVISGDFTFIGSEGEFEEARTAIRRLLGILDLSTDHLVLIPGNHDIQWTTNANYEPNAPVVEAPAKARANYERFYKAVMGHEAGRYLAMGRRFALPCGLIVEICALNSSSLETGASFLAGMGRIDEGAFTDVAGRLGWTSAQTFALRMLVVHHHLALTEDLEPAEGYGKGYGLAVDAVRIQRLATRSGVHLALHGHKHRAFIWRSSVYELPEHTQTRYHLGELSIIGGGSCGSQETEGNSNYFNVITPKPTELGLDMYRSIQRGAFGMFSQWNAELSVESGTGLRLGEWNKVE